MFNKFLAADPPLHPSAGRAGGSHVQRAGGSHVQRAGGSRVQRAGGSRVSRAVGIAAVFLAAAAFAAAPLGTATIYGEVHLGAAGPAPSDRSQPVVGGETISTGKDGWAAIRTWRAGRLEVRQDSRAALYEDRLELESGSAAAERLPIRFGEYTVEPQNPGAESWFAVGEREGARIVAAHRGAVVIRRAGSQPTIVPAGAYAMPRPRAGADKNAEEDKDSSSKSPAQGRSAHAAGSKGGWRIGSLSHGKSVLLAVGVAAGAGTGVAAGLAAGGDKQLALSPSQ